MSDLLTTAQAIEAARYNDARALDLLVMLRSFFGVDQQESARSYTEALAQRIAWFQRRFDLSVDGKIGPTTHPLILEQLGAADAGPLWPAEDAPPEARLAHYTMLCKLVGHDPTGSKTTLLGLRGVRLFGLRTHIVRSRNEYDDAFVLLNFQGDEKVYEFRGATHPYQKTSTASPDADGDGRPDVGMLRPGHYHVQARSDPYKGHPALVVLRTSGVNRGRLPAYRDTNHDGLFDEAEMRASETATSGGQVSEGIGAWMDQVLFHPGLGFSSIGCQTARPEDIRKLHALGKFEYLLVNAVDVLALMKQRR
ncbi:hypothetical protein [Sorangium sp. So ce861]|uniref:hypothetical protein n=1 Tax=Sorangium sp. So ce861 TaxID=3133323 RepID=UPI003F5EB342